MTTTVEMPALDGRSPLGFLASLGLLRTLAMTGVNPLSLSFSRSSAAALLNSPLVSVEEIAEQLEHLLASAPENVAVIGVDPRFPLPAGRGGDPMRRPRETFRNLVAEIRSIDYRAASEWMPCLFTDLAVDLQGRADLTPFCAPSGKQNLRTFFEKPLSGTRADPSRVGEALNLWRRVDGFTGEYLDHRVINSAADDPRGHAAERGVPGATWLATMAIPLLRLAGDGEHASATLWHRMGRRSVMIWPLWEQPLDVVAIQTLIEHPCLVPVDSRPAVRNDAWHALGVFAVCGAERQRISGRNFAGVLAPCAVVAEPG
jgi:hypothetical protein